MKDRNFHLEAGRDLFVVPLEDGVHSLIYAPLDKVAFVANGALAERVTALIEGRCPSDSELRAWLHDIGIDQEGAAEIDTLYVGPPRPTSVTLFLTTACNLRCTYCYAHGGEQPLEALEEQTALRSIDVVVDNAVSQGAREIGLAFHGGGEPSVAWTVLTRSLGYARAAAAARGLTVFASITTNGVLSEAKARWLTENLDFATVSCDGLPEVQNRNRLTVLGSGSSALVERTLAVFDDAAFRYGVRLTVTPADVLSLPASVEHLCSLHNPELIQVEPAHRLGRWEGHPTPDTSAFIDAFRVARDRAAACGVPVVFSAARLDVQSRHFCGVSRDTFAVAPGGGVSACYEVFSRRDPNADIFFYGSVSPGGFVADSTKLDHLRSQTVDSRAYCETCFARWHCSGDCYHKVLLAGGENFNGTERCHITRELLKDAIIERISAAGGVVWSGASADRGVPSPNHDSHPDHNGG